MEDAVGHPQVYLRNTLPGRLPSRGCTVGGGARRTVIERGARGANDYVLADSVEAIGSAGSCVLNASPKVRSSTDVMSVRAGADRSPAVC